MSITSITKKTKERVHSRKPHESYLDKKLTHCPNCSAEVYWSKDENGYECWVCSKCGEKYLYRLPLHHESERYLTTPEAERLRKEYFGSTPTPTTSTNATPPKPSTSPTPVTPTMTPKSSDDNRGPITFQEARDRLWKMSHPTKNQHTSPPSKSSEPEPKDSPINSQGQVCSACKGKTLTVGSPVMVKLQCPDHIKEAITELSRLTLKGQRQIKELRETIASQQLDLHDLRRKVGYLEEDLRKKNFLQTYHQPAWTTRRER